MYLVSVIPISPTSKDSLTYFAQHKLTVGTLVCVSMRGKKVAALVVKVENAKQKKSEIRSASFTTKKITDRESIHLISPEFLAATNDISDYHATHIGKVLHSLIPKALLDTSIAYADNKEALSKKQSAKTYIFQDKEHKRLAHYTTLIKKSFSQKKSVFILVPTTSRAQHFFEALQDIYDTHCFLLHSSLTPKQQRDQWRAALGEEHPVCIVATSTFLSLPRHDIGTIIIEEESSFAYKTRTRPYLDMRVVARYVAGHTHAQLIVSATRLSVETLYAYQTKQFTALKTPTQQLDFRSDMQVVNMKEEKTPPHTEVAIISAALQNLIDTTIKNKQRCFLYTLRRGHASLTICSDCGTPVSCSRCNAPLVLHTPDTASERVYTCHHCGNIEKTLRRCSTCESWNLKPLGIGIDRVAEELQKLYPDQTLLRLDSDHAKTQKQARQIIQQWQTTDSSILLGTDMALPYLSTHEYSAVVSLDTLFAIPDFRMPERIVDILLTLRAHTTKKLLIQTRQPDQKTLQYAANGDLKGFYTHDIAQRKQFNYPPFSVFIKISIQGNKTTLERDMAHLTNILSGYNFTHYPGTPKRTLRSKAPQESMHTLLSLPRENWPDTKLLSRLRALPLSFAINVNPESIL